MHADINKLEKYIKEELNVLEVGFVSNEDEYVEYKTEPNHKELGQEYGKKYTKKLKEKLAKLENEEIKKLFTDGKLELEGVEIRESHLKISKQFNQKYES